MLRRLIPAALDDPGRYARSSSPPGRELLRTHATFRRNIRAVSLYDSIVSLITISNLSAWKKIRAACRFPSKNERDIAG